MFDHSQIDEDCESVADAKITSKKAGK